MIVVYSIANKGANNNIEKTSKIVYNMSPMRCDTMDKNLILFLNNCLDIENIDKSMINFEIFTSLPLALRNLNNVTLFSLLMYHIIKDKKGYQLIKNNQKYQFKILSDENINSVDKKYLLDYKKRKNAIKRILKLACSKDLNNANFIVASTNSGIKFLIECQKGNEQIIIDYMANLIMKKDEYKHLYNLKEINRITQENLYKIYHIINEYDALMINPNYYFLFSNEIINELAKKDTFKWLSKKYNSVGINMANYFWMGNNCDCLFFEDEDIKSNLTYDKIREFTLNPTCDNVNFSYDDKINYYLYKGKIKFRLISDLINNEEIKKDLLSDNRYHTCHSSSIKLLFGVNFNNASNYLVNGKVKVNENDYFYHSWLEIVTLDNKEVVFDYTNNLIMDKADYYKLINAKVINVTDKETLKAEIDLLNNFELNFHPMILGYFSQEIKKDLEKNIFLIKEKK